jgi:hypothetical protein
VPITRSLQSRSVWWRPNFCRVGEHSQTRFRSGFDCRSGYCNGSQFDRQKRRKHLDAETISSAQVPVISAPSASPEIIEQTKIVEVPVIRERIVTRVVYVERQGRAADLPARNPALFSSRKDLRRNSPNSNPKDTFIAMKGSVAQNGYLTRIDLTGFQPTNGMNARVVREVKNDEK